jgi:hypothetical protein
MAGATSILSPKTLDHLRIIIQEEGQAEAIRLLVEECGNNLPFCENSTPQSLERIRFAALKLSKGNLLGLHKAVELAKLDWRDLLVAAGFGDDIKAHERWNP